MLTWMVMGLLDGEGMFCEDRGVEFGGSECGSRYGSRIRGSFAYTMITDSQSILLSVTAITHFVVNTGTLTEATETGLLFGFLTCVIHDGKVVSSFGGGTGFLRVPELRILDKVLTGDPGTVSTGVTGTTGTDTASGPCSLVSSLPITFVSMMMSVILPAYRGIGDEKSGGCCGRLSLP